MCLGFRVVVIHVTVTVFPLLSHGESPMVSQYILPGTLHSKP